MHIDWWTLTLQTVNVLILIWLLARFFFRPVMDIVAKRQREASKLIDDAAKARHDAVEARAKAEQERAGVAAEREQLIAQAQKAAQLEKQNIMAQAVQEIGKRRDEAAAAIARNEAAAEAAVIDRAGTLAIDIAQRLLERFRARDLLSTFIDEMCRDLRALSPQARQSLAAAATAEHPIAVITAVPLSDAEQRKIGAAFQEVFGRDLPVAFRTDPQIVNGIELRGQNTIIRNSWRADLNRIRRELKP
jgi:F-type H+-transporting ATPase subunit b